MMQDDSEDIPEEAWEESDTLPAADFSSMDQSWYSVVRDAGSNEVMGYFTWTPPRLAGNSPWGGGQSPVDWSKVAHPNSCIPHHTPLPAHSTVRTAVVCADVG